MGSAQSSEQCLGEFCIDYDQLTFEIISDSSTGAQKASLVRSHNHARMHVRRRKSTCRMLDSIRPAVKTFQTQGMNLQGGSTSHRYGQDSNSRLTRVFASEHAAVH